MIARPATATVILATNASAPTSTSVIVAAAPSNSNNGSGLADGVIEYAKSPVSSTAAVPSPPPSRAAMTASSEVGGSASGMSPTSPSPALNLQPAMLGGSPAPVVLGDNATAAQGAIRPLSSAPTNPRSRAGVAGDMNASGASGGLTIAQRFGGPFIWGSGDVIGGPGGATIVSPDYAADIQAVTWSVTGAETGQDYRNIKGSTTDFTGSRVWNFGGTIVAELKSLYYNYQDGDHTITAGVTYTDGSTATATTTVKIKKPDVLSMRITHDAANAEQAEGDSRPGSSVAMDSSQGATIFVGDNMAGSVAVIQMINYQGSATNQPPGAEKPVVHTINSGMVLDNAPDEGDGDNDVGYVEKDQIVHINSGNAGEYVGSDRPILGTIDTKVDGPCVAYKFSYTFMDYLVYRPDGGIWVKLAEVGPYTMSADMVFNPLGGPNGMGGFEEAPGTTIKPVGNSGGPLKYTESPGFVSWDNYFYERASSNTAFNPPYTSD